MRGVDGSSLEGGEKWTGGVESGWRGTISEAWMAYTLVLAIVGVGCRVYLMIAASLCSN